MFQAFSSRIISAAHVIFLEMELTQVCMQFDHDFWGVCFRGSRLSAGEIQTRVPLLQPDN